MTRTMKKVLAGIIAATLLSAALILSGCQSASPSKTLSDELDKLKKVNFEQVLENPSAIGGIDIPSLLNINTESIASMTDDQKATISAIVTKILDFDYKVNSEQVDGDTATVNVTFTTYDFKTAMKTALQNVISQAVTLVLSGGTQADVEALTYQAIQEAVDALSEKTATGTIDIPMVKFDGKWQVGTLSNDMLDVIFGGLLTSLSDFK